MKHTGISLGINAIISIVLMIGSEFMKESRFYALAGLGVAILYLALVIFAMSTLYRWLQAAKIHQAWTLVGLIHPIAAWLAYMFLRRSAVATSNGEANPNA